MVSTAAAGLGVGPAAGKGVARRGRPGGVRGPEGVPEARPGEGVPAGRRSPGGVPAGGRDPGGVRGPAGGRAGTRAAADRSLGLEEEVLLGLHKNKIHITISTSKQFTQSVMQHFDTTAFP